MAKPEISSTCLGGAAAPARPPGASMAGEPRPTDAGGAGWRTAARSSGVRRSIEEVYEKRIADLDAVARIALTTHELLENAVKFAANGSTRLLIETESVDPGSDRVVISVFNHSDLANIHKLNGAFA